MANGLAGLLGAIGTGVDALGGGVPSVYGGLLSEDELRAAKSRAQQDALAKMASALYAAGAPSRTPGGGTGQAIAQALQAGREGYQGALSGQLQEKMAQQKIQQALAAQKRTADVNQLIQGAFQQAQPAQKAPMIGGAPYGMDVPAQPAKFDLQAIAPQLMTTAEGRQALQNLQGMMKPEYKTVGDQLFEIPQFGLGGAPRAVGGAPKKSDLQRQYEYAKTPAGGGFKGTFEQFKAASAPRTTVNVTDKSFMSGFGGGASDILLEGRQQAASAVRTINAIQDTLPMLKDGVYSGPFSSQEKLIARVADKFNIGGKNTAEKLKNTASAVQNLAKLELQAAEAMKGQGQITENERALIKRASGGDLENMTAKEVETLLVAMDKTARYRIQDYQTRLNSVPDIAKSPYRGLYDIQMPAPLSIPVKFTMPNGSIVTFPNQQALDKFKQEAGIR